MGALQETRPLKRCRRVYAPVTTEPRWYWPRRMRTTFLFPKPSFLSGFASILDISGNLGPYNHSRTGEEADTRALYSDYRMIFQDIEDTMRVFDAKCSGQERLFDPDEAKPAS